MSHPNTRVTLDVALRRHLADRQWSGRQLAERTGLPYRRVARTLRGDREVTLTELAVIAAALDMSIEALIADTVPFPAERSA